MHGGYVCSLPRPGTKVNRQPHQVQTSPRIRAWLASQKSDVSTRHGSVFAQSITYDLFVRTRELPAAIAHRGASTKGQPPTLALCLETKPPHRSPKPRSPGLSRRGGDRLADAAALAMSGAKIWALPRSRGRLRMRRVFSIDRARRAMLRQVADRRYDWRSACWLGYGAIKRRFTNASEDLRVLSSASRIAIEPALHDKALGRECARAMPVDFEHGRAGTADCAEYARTARVRRRGGDESKHESGLARTVGESRPWIIFIHKCERS